MTRWAHGLFSAAACERPGEMQRGVVVGHDARIDSDRFAECVASVAAGFGLRVHRFDGPVPTPLVSFGVRHLRAGLGVMITASHNPPVYNGMKVFEANGAQIVPPFDAAVERAIASAPAASEVATSSAPATVVDLDHAYVEALDGCRIGSGPLDLEVAYSPLHGVGARLFTRLAERHGLTLRRVESQVEPDGRFPTVRSPNPEDTEALERALDLGRSVGADLVLVHDPDGDRLAAAVAHAGELRVLTGDQIGVLLADHRLSAASPTPVVMSTVVSSRMIEALAAARGARSIRTPTGFKWMARAAARLPSGQHLVLAYEQALGYAVGDVVRDKDGLGAGLALAEAASVQRRRGGTLVDRWRALEAELGVFHPAAITLSWPPGEEARARAAFERYRATPPAGGSARVEPEGIEGPVGDLVLDVRPDGSWVAVRPSGTEPKLKVYIEAYEPPGPDAPARAADEAEQIRSAVAARLGEGR